MRPNGMRDSSKWTRLCETSDITISSK